MNKNVKLFNAVKIKDLGLSNDLINFIDNQTQNDKSRCLTKAWVAEAISLMRRLKSNNSEAFDQVMMDELSQLAQLMIDKRIIVVMI